VFLSFYSPSAISNLLPLSHIRTPPLLKYEGVEPTEAHMASILARLLVAILKYSGVYMIDTAAITAHEKNPPRKANIRENSYILDILLFTFFLFIFKQALFPEQIYYFFNFTM
jgi:hypothetical protein